MGKRDKSEKKEKRKGRFGAFFGGGFLGFNLAIALLVGIFCFAYFKVSVDWINKTFKTEIDLGSEEINSKTISTLVNNAISLTENADTYKLKNLKNDFGIEIKDELFGIDITDLKEVAISDLADAIENKFGTISADELRNVSGMNLETEMGKILNKENTYYYNTTDNKLYKKVSVEKNPSGYELVSFKYELNSAKTQVTSKGYIADIDALTGEVKIPLWYLPLTVALGDFTSNMGEQITLKELEEDYGVTLPSFFNSVNKEETTINELEDAINGLMVKDILNLNIKSYKANADSPTIYYDDDNNNNIKDAGESEVSYILKSIADTQIDGLSGVINSFKLSQIFSSEERSEGILSLITGDPTIDQIPDAIKTAVTTAKLQKLYDEGIITLSAEDAAKLSVKIDHDKNSGTATVAVGDLNINELFNYCFDLLPNA